jgi:hypothetical protein
MTEKETRVFHILEYLNKLHVRKNQKLTEDILKSQFDFTTIDFDQAFKEIESQGYIYRREGTDYIAISSDGEIKYNDLYTKMTNDRSEVTSEKQRIPKEINYGLIGIILTLVGGAFVLGLMIGSVKYDREKIELQHTVDSLNERIKELKEEETNELKNLKIENKNVWDTYQKIREENERLKKGNTSK